MLAAGLDDQHAAAAGRVFGLVILSLVVADEAALVIPVGRIGLAVLVELVVPNHFPVAGRIGGGERRGGEAKQNARGRNKADRD